MEKKTLAKLAIAGLIAGLVSTQGVQADESCNSPTILSAGCGGNSPRGGHSCSSQSGPVADNVVPMSPPDRNRTYTPPRAGHSCASAPRTADQGNYPQNGNYQHHDNYPQNGNYQSNQQVKDAFKDSIGSQEAREMYNQLSPEERKAAWKAVNEDSKKTSDQAVREIYQKKTGQQQVPTQKTKY